MTGAEQDKFFYQEAMHKLEASQIPAGFQGKQETQWSQEETAFPLCPSIRKAADCWQWRGSARASEPSTIFNNNNPLACVLWALVFHNLVPLPLNPGCLRKEEG